MLVSKSVRLPYDLVCYIDSCEGDSFTAKLIDILDDYISGDEQRRKQMDAYEKIIKERQERLDILTNDIEVLGNIKRMSCKLGSTE